MYAAIRRRLVAAGLLTLAAPLALLPRAQAEGTVSFEAAINGTDVAEADPNDPVLLRPSQPIDIVLTIRNRSGADVEVRSVRMVGTIMGLTFLAYEVRADVGVSSGATERRRFEIDPADLGSQAVGLVPARVELLDRNRGVIASRRFTADVRGSLASVEGTFAVGVALITGVLLSSVLVRLARQRLPASRWRRGIRFAAPGFGLGLTATFTLSVFRVLVPEPSFWLPFAIGGGGVFFVLGYLSPRPQSPEEEAEQVEADLAAIERATAAEDLARFAPVSSALPDLDSSADPDTPFPGRAPETPPSSSPPPGVEPPEDDRSTVVTDNPLPPPPPA